MASCVVDQVTDLPVCDVAPAEVLLLHQALQQASAYLFSHHLAPGTAPYTYRTDYLPDKITGNDVVALSRLAQELGVRGFMVPLDLATLLPEGTGGIEYVTPMQVEYVADSASSLARAAEDALAAIMEWDASRPRPNAPWGWIFALAVGVVMATTTAAVLSKKKGSEEIEVEEVF